MPLVMVRAEVQADVPAGTITVSPSAADTTALLTSAREGLAALIILACAPLEAAKSSTARTALGTAQFGRNINGELQSKGRWRCAPPGTSQHMPNQIRGPDGIWIAISQDSSDFQDLKLQRLLKKPCQKQRPPETYGSTYANSM